MSIEVYFATNRNLTGTEKKPDFGEYFNVKGPHYIRYGRATLEVDGEEKLKPGERRGEKDRYTEPDLSLVLGTEYKVTKVELAPEKIPTAAQAAAAEAAGRQAKTVLGSDAIFDALRESMANGAEDVIVLIHGYSCTFENALQNAAAIKERYHVNGRQCNVFVFTWPSDGSTTPFVAYHSDRKDAAASGVAIARSFLRLYDYLYNLDASKYCRQRIHLVAHSMGNYALRHAVQGIRSELGDKAIPRLLDNVFLMCADEDDDAFEHDHKLRLLPEMAKSVHVYFSPDDMALTISDLTKRNPDRLGSNGPRLGSGLPRKVTLVDCRNTDRTTLFDANHQYYRRRREVVEDVCAVLSGIPAGEIPWRVWMPDERSFRLKSAAERG